MLFNRKHILKNIGILFGLFILFVFASVQYTARPDFCNTCHYMEPFYEAWAVSSHNDVSCITCHYPPTTLGALEGKFRGLIQVVNYVGQTYKRSKPWAEIPDASCLQSDCHDTRLLEGEVTFGKVRFDHAHHLGQLKRGKDLRCTSCHSQIVQGDHMNVTDSSCFLCHFKDKSQNEIASSCVTCHNWDAVIQAGSMDDFNYDHTDINETGKECVLCHTNMIVGDGAVPVENCYQCHFERERLNLFDDTELMHTTHIAKNKIECQNCHLRIQHKIQPMSTFAKVEDCTSCHTDYHQAQYNLYTGTGGVDTDTLPNPMHDIGLNCKGCHIFHEENGVSDKLTGATEHAGSAACERCHGSGFNRILQNWEAVTGRHTQHINSQFRVVRAALKRAKLPDAQQQIVQRLVDDATYNVEIVRSGKSVHNVQYAHALHNVAHTKLAEAAGILEVKLPQEAAAIDEELIPTECANCHFGIEETERPIYGLTFKHNVHVADNQFDCSLCHSNTRRHGELSITKAECADCHHASDSIDCGGCHTLQYSMMAGTPDFYDKEVEGIMPFLAEDCLSCHEVEAATVKRPVGETCNNCHGEGYEFMLTDWLDDGKQRVTDLTKAVQEKIRNPGGLDRSKLRTMEQWLRNFQTDGSRSVHNRELFDDALFRIEEYVTPKTSEVQGDELPESRQAVPGEEPTELGGASGGGA